ncbi:MAG: hypothetical protein KDD52_05860 [Bdellovibrionales bacterium]|nr:hypothetical protein [Bdellovibrionales bacterium]
MKKRIEDILIGMKLLSPEDRRGGGKNFRYDTFTQRARGQNFTIHFFQALDSHHNIKENAPTVLLASILNQDIKLEMVLARSFAQQGIHAVTVDTINIKDVFAALSKIEDMSTMVDSLNIIIRSYQKTLNWMRTRLEIDNQKIGVFGMSFGGIVLSYISAMNSDIQAGIYAVSGCDFRDIFCHSREPAVRAARNRIICNEWMKDSLRQSTPKSNWAWSKRPIPNHLVQRLHDQLEGFTQKVPDIYVLSPDIKKDIGNKFKDKAMILYASKDDVFTRRQNDLQWEIFGKPERIFFDRLDHYAAGFFITFVYAQKYIHWFGKRFGLSIPETIQRKSLSIPKTYFHYLKQLIKQKKDSSS